MNWSNWISVDFNAFYDLIISGWNIYIFRISSKRANSPINQVISEVDTTIRRNTENQHPQNKENLHSSDLLRKLLQFFIYTYRQHSFAGFAFFLWSYKGVGDCTTTWWNWLTKLIKRRACVSKSRGMDKKGLGKKT